MIWAEPDQQRRSRGRGPRTGRRGCPRESVITSDGRGGGRDPVVRASEGSDPSPALFYFILFFGAFGVFLGVISVF